MYIKKKYQCQNFTMHESQICPPTCIFLYHVYVNIVSNGIKMKTIIIFQACVAIPTMVQTQGTATFLGHNFQRFDCCTTSKCNRNIHVEQGVGRR